MKKTIIALWLCWLVQGMSGQVHYSDTATSVGIIHNYNGVLGGGVSFIDFDNDGLDDITLATGLGEEIHFYKNNGTNFIKLPALIHLEKQAKHILWVDFDNDGDYDLYITNYESTNRLFENKGQLNFEDITEDAGLPLNSNTTYGACFGDIDRDGWLDLYYNDRVPFMTGDNRHYLFRNNADGTFTDIAEISQSIDGGKVPFCSAFIDYNNDKWPDIYTAHDKFIIPNVLLENNGDGTFSDVGMNANADLNMDAMCVNPGDYNNDGWMDIYITNTPTEGSALLHNIGPGNDSQVRFGNSAMFAGVPFSQRTGWGSVFLDADNDSDLDLYVVAADYGDIAQANSFYLNTGNSIFSEPNAGFEGDTTITYNTAIGDFNNDGFSDIIVVNKEPFLTQLWTNNGGENNWIKIKLQGVLSNRDGIGSKIESYSGGQYQMRYILCGNGFLGQNSLTEIIGINNIEKADSIIITWPTGHIDKLFDIVHGEKLTILEGITTNGNIQVDDDVELTLLLNNIEVDKKEAPFIIYPNPVSDILTIKMTGNSIVQYVLLNAKGQIIQSSKSGNPEFNINVTSFLPGHYYLLTIDKKGMKYIEQWVKQ